jgi:hypothetical protein
MGFKEGYAARKAQLAGAPAPEVPAAPAPTFGERYREAREERAERGASVGAKLSGSSQYLTEPRMQVPTFEYAIIQYPSNAVSLDSIRTEINAMGSHGWELCERRDSGTGVARGGDLFFTLFFKRRTS